MNTVLFDLDGTLLPMDLDVFIKVYMEALKKKFEELGLDGDKCVKSVLAGTKAMYKNEGEITNELCFWNTFTSLSGVLREDVEAELNIFYKEVFPYLDVCSEGKSENMIKAVALLKEKGYKLILATNPLFPSLATKARIMWAGLNEKDFDLVTSYEHCNFTKPNVNYFKEVINKMNLNVNECMMVGNDSLEDGVVETLGIPLYLVTDHLIHRDNTPLNSKWHGTSQQFLTFVEAMPNIK